MHVNELLSLKSELATYFKNKLNMEGVEKSLNDPHSKRAMKPSGLNVHPGYNCPHACTYCYIEDLGYQFKPTQPSNLTAKELAFALLNNKYFIPGRFGSFIALGDVCDPFHPRVKEITFSYISIISQFLKNPIQFSTKMYLSEIDVHRLRESLGKNTISPLITITTLKNRKLEPGAPPPELRLKTISNLSKDNFSPFIFLRPVVPGITDKECQKILEMGRSAGAVGVVIGSLRVSERILERMKLGGIDITPILRRLKKVDNGMKYIEDHDLKEMILHTAKDLGLRVVLASCCASAYEFKVSCPNLHWMSQICTRCFQCWKFRPRLQKSDIKNALEYALEIDASNVQDIKIDKNCVDVFLPQNIITKISTNELRILWVLLRKKVRLKGIK